MTPRTNQGSNNSPTPSGETGRAAMLFCMPGGLPVSGISTWAVRLSGQLINRGWRVAMIVHEEPRAHGRVGFTLPAGIELIELKTGVPMDQCRGDYSPFMPTYRDTIRRLARETGRPVVVSPNLSSECYGLIAAMARVEPEIIRVVGWCHNDTEYDLAGLEHYARSIHRFVGVSETIAERLRERLPKRAGDITNIPYGIPVPSAPSRREPIGGRPVKIIYTGRMDSAQKRPFAIIEMSAALHSSGVPHELLMVGDGPQAPEIDRRLSAMPWARRLGGNGSPPTPDEIAGFLADSDVFVLPSRFEGLSVSMLEAMAAGCVPVVTAVESGAREMVVPGVTGELVDAAIEDDADLGRAMAEGVRRAIARGLPALSRAAHARVAQRCTIEHHADTVHSMFGAILRDPHRVWVPTASGERFSVSWAAENARRGLRALRGRTIALWGAGRHTVSIAPELDESPAHVAAIIDDDLSLIGTSVCGYPIVAIDDLPGMGVTDVIISSWMYEKAMWKRRKPLEKLGLRVHRLYGDQVGVIGSQFVIEPRKKAG